MSDQPTPNTSLAEAATVAGGSAQQRPQLDPQ